VQWAGAQIDDGQPGNTLNRVIQKLQAEQVWKELDVGSRVVKQAEHVGDLPLLAHRQGDPDLVDVVPLHIVGQAVHSSHWFDGFERASIGTGGEPALDLDT